MARMSHLYRIQNETLALIATTEEQARILADLRRRRHSDLCQCTCPPEKFPQAFEARAQKLTQLAEERDAVERRANSESIAHQLELRHYAQEEARLAREAAKLKERAIAMEAEYERLKATHREVKQKYKTVTKRVLLRNEQLDELRAQVEVMQQAADQVQAFEEHQNHLHALRQKRSAAKVEQAEQMLQASNVYACGTQQKLQKYIMDLDELYQSSVLQQTPEDPGMEQVLGMIKEKRQKAVTALPQFQVAAAGMHVELARAARQEPCPAAAAMHEAAAAAEVEEEEAGGGTATEAGGCAAAATHEAGGATQAKGAERTTEAEGGGGAAAAMHKGGAAEEAAAHVPHRLVCRKRKQTDAQQNQEGRTKRVCVSKAGGMSSSLPTAASVAGPSAMEVDAAHAPSEKAQMPLETELVEEEQVQHAAAAAVGVEIVPEHAVAAAAGVGAVPEYANEDGAQQGLAAGRHQQSSPAAHNSGVASQLEGAEASRDVGLAAAQAVHADEAASSHDAAADTGRTLRRSKRKQDASEEEEESAKRSRGISGKRTCGIRAPVEQPSASTAATADPASSSSAAAAHQDADLDLRQGKGCRRVVQLRRSTRLQQAACKAASKEDCSGKQ